MKKANYANSFKTLIINSCGKVKVVSQPDQPACDDLTTSEQRKKKVQDFSNFLTSVRKLYAGGQAKAIVKAVDLLRKKCVVDYYVISAGFGVVKEFNMLPPYDCTFSNRSDEEILEISRRLRIRESLLQLSQTQYDLVYLALGKDYLTAVEDLNSYKDIGKEIIHFSKNIRNLTHNFHSVNQNIFVNKAIPSSIFPVPNGNFIRAKGTLLLNYAIDMQGDENNYSFVNWWKRKKRQIKRL